MSGTDTLVEFARDVAIKAYSDSQAGVSLSAVLMAAETSALDLARRVERAKAAQAAEEKQGPPAAPPDVPWSTAPSDSG